MKQGKNYYLINSCSNLNFLNFLKLKFRKLNVIALCKLLPLFDKDTFLFFINNIFHICLVTVHADMMKKLERDILKSEIVSNITTTKNLNVRQSDRKIILTSNDSLNKIDVHSLFVQNINVRKYFYNYCLVFFE